MKIEDIIKQFSEHQGMNLVDFAEVALPIYRVTSNILVHEKVELDTIEEFILRAVNLGFNSVEKINDLLGLSTEISKEGLTQLIRSDLLIEKLNGIVELTPQGLESVDNHSKVRPEEQQIIFDYDGLIRKVRLSKDNIYLAPKEVKSDGLIEIRPIPAKKPDAKEIDLQQVDDYIGSYKGIRKSEKTLLRVRSITRAVRLFYKAIMLIYRKNSNGNYEAAFCIDNQLSEKHALAFMSQEGLKRLYSISDLSVLNLKNLKKEYYYHNFYCLPPVTTKATSPNKNTKNTLSLQKSTTIPKISQYTDYFLDSLNTSTKSLIIISPYLTSKVVDHDFYSKINKLVNSGADVYLAYEDDDSLAHTNSWASIIDLSKTNKKLTLCKSENLSANILVKDNEYYVITNFPFLSYKGNTKKKIADTWGNYVSDGIKVKQFSDKTIMKHFNTEG